MKGKDVAVRNSSTDALKSQTNAGGGWVVAVLLTACLGGGGAVAALYPEEAMTKANGGGGGGGESQPKPVSGWGHPAGAAVTRKCADISKPGQVDILLGEVESSGPSVLYRRRPTAKRRGAGGVYGGGGGRGARWWSPGVAVVGWSS